MKKICFILVIISCFYCSLAYSLDGDAAVKKETYYDSGAIKSRGTYRWGKRNGVFREYYENGQLKSIASYRMDEVITKENFENKAAILRREFEEKYGTELRRKKPIVPQVKEKVLVEEKKEVVVEVEPEGSIQEDSIEKGPVKEGVSIEGQDADELEDDKGIVEGAENDLSSEVQEKKEIAPKKKVRTKSKSSSKKKYQKNSYKYKYNKSKSALKHDAKYKKKKYEKEWNFGARRGEGIGSRIKNKGKNLSYDKKKIKGKESKFKNKKIDKYEKKRFKNSKQDGVY